MNIAVILAGGVGNRVGAGIPKQFIEVLGKPVIAYTIEPFDRHPDIDAILVVCVKPYVDYIWQVKEEYGFNKLKWVTVGGDTFQESVLNGVEYLQDKILAEDIVLFHFSASPFISSDIISDVIRVCAENGSNAISTTDYYLLSGEKALTSSVSDSKNYSDKYINRETIAVMNTPHAFKYGFVSNLYKEAIETGVINSVEPHTTTLMYALGKRIYFSKGNQTNIKITTKEDLSLFEGYVLEKQRKDTERLEGDVVVFLADGFEECEGLLVVDLLRRAGLTVVMASITGSRDVKSSRGILVQADCLAENFSYDKAQMLILPGGRMGTMNLCKSKFVREMCKKFAKEKDVAAICAAPTILDNLGLLKGKSISVHPDFEKEITEAFVSKEDVTVDGNIITGRGLGVTILFALRIIERLLGRSMAERVSNGICFKLND